MTHRIVIPVTYKTLLDASKYSGGISTAIDRCSQFYGDPTPGAAILPGVH